MELSEQEFLCAVQQLREEPIKDLHFSPAVERLLDHTILSSLQDQLSQGPSKWERFKATSDLKPQIPRAKGLYMFVWAPSLKFEFEDSQGGFEAKWILYIGKAGVNNGVRDTLQDRYQTYSKWIGGDPAQMWFPRPSSSGREQRLERFLTLRPLEYWCLVVEDDRYISTMERRLVRMFSPPLNVSDTIRARLGKERPAW